MQQRFNFINQCVKKLRAEQINTISLENKSLQCAASSMEIMDSVCEIYTNLCQGAKQINNACGLPLFSLVIVSFTEILLLGYCRLFVPEEDVDFKRKLARALIYLFILFLTLLTTGSVRREVRSGYFLKIHNFIFKGLRFSDRDHHKTFSRIRCMLHESKAVVNCTWQIFFQLST